jgi:hypothetical protein
MPLTQIEPYMSNSSASFTYSGVVTLGSAANVKITGGTNGQVLSTDGTGNLTWSPANGTVPIAAYSRTTFTATANQTVFSVTYTAGFILVFVNGTMLPSSSYTATNGTSIVLTYGAGLGNIVEVISFSFTTPVVSVATPIVNGPTSANEAVTTTFNISNYNASYAYYIAVTGGSYTRSGATISWTLPLVSADTVHTINVQAVYLGTSSSYGGASITVTDVPLPGDIGLYITDFTSFTSNDGWVF